jgi:hypothetical protein
MFLRGKGLILLHLFTDLNFVISLAYLADAPRSLNYLNISLQGTEVTILEAERKSSPSKRNYLSGEEE